jgi:hypothetical protein
MPNQMYWTVPMRPGGDVTNQECGGHFIRSLRELDRVSNGPSSGRVMNQVQAA